MKLAQKVWNSMWLKRPQTVFLAWLITWANVHTHPVFSFPPLNVTWSCLLLQMKSEKHKKTVTHAHSDIFVSLSSVNCIVITWSQCSTRQYRLKGHGHSENKDRDVWTVWQHKHPIKTKDKLVLLNYRTTAAEITNISSQCLFSPRAPGRELENRHREEAVR